MAAPQSSSPSTVVYVVDDDESVRDSFDILLQSYGFAVETFASTKAFVAARHAPAKACLILDQHLGPSTGLDFLASPGGIALGMPVILITGRGDNSIRDRAVALGVAAYLEKPVDDQALLKAIHSITAN